jgi:hypothetical protein
MAVTSFPDIGDKALKDDGETHLPFPVSLSDTFDDERSSNKLVSRPTFLVFAGISRDYMLSVWLVWSVVVVDLGQSTVVLTKMAAI